MKLRLYEDGKFTRWHKEVADKGYNITRKRKREIDEIRKMLEDDYIKEGADIEVDGIWVKAKSIVTKENKETTGEIESFRSNLVLRRYEAR
jgi:intein-encoded DNA endonuclease-like protein